MLYCRCLKLLNQHFQLMLSKVDVRFRRSLDVAAILAADVSFLDIVSRLSRFEYFIQSLSLKALLLVIIYYVSSLNRSFDSRTRCFNVFIRLDTLDYLLLLRFRHLC